MLLLHDQGHLNWPWLCEVATQSTWPVCKFGINAVAVPSTLGTHMWEDWCEMMVRTGCGGSLAIQFDLRLYQASSESVLFLFSVLQWTYVETKNTMYHHNVSSADYIEPLC